jgi:hypothetical protein
MSHPAPTTCSHEPALDARLASQNRRNAVTCKTAGTAINGQ